MRIYYTHIIAIIMRISKPFPAGGRFHKLKMGAYNCLSYLVQDDEKHTFALSVMKKFA